MGDRGNIYIIDTPDTEHGIYLYTHWDGYQLDQVLAKALQRGQNRIGDHPYLSRIIFSEMIKSDVEGDTGYGLSTLLGDNQAGNPILVANLHQGVIYERPECEEKRPWDGEEGTPINQYASTILN